MHLSRLIIIIQTVEKRKAELNVYLKELLLVEPQISESDVIYTFLHCLIRDEEDLIKVNEGTWICTYLQCTSRWARFARPPAAYDSDIFHYITAYIHNMHAIES